MSQDHQLFTENVSKAFLLYTFLLRFLSQSLTKICDVQMAFKSVPIFFKYYIIVMQDAFSINNRKACKLNGPYSEQVTSSNYY